MIPEILKRRMIYSLQVFEADTCSDSYCSNATCRCSTTDPPMEIAVDDLPQFVLLSFDDAVTVSNKDFYLDLSSKYKNPNGCPIQMTFFVSHENTDYTYVNELHRQNHEIATRSVS